MARQLKSTFTGTIGNLTFYKLWNRYYVRLKSSGGVQTEATKKCQQPFAMAATIGAGIRKMLHPAIPKPTSKEMQNRLSKAVLQWLRSDAYATSQYPCQVPELQGFQFVPQTVLQQLFPVHISVQTSPEQTLSIHFPAFIPKQHGKAPQGTKCIQLQIAAGSYNLEQRKIASAFSHTIEISYTANEIKEQIIRTPITFAPHHLLITTVSIFYKIKQPGSPLLIPVQQHQWRASSIIDARYC